MKRYIIKVTGRVQGVFFRDTARQVATQLGLVGFARNEPDGSVHIEVEGQETALHEFLQWCPKGSDYAEVTNVEHSEHQAVGHQGFKILRN
jgi:acylphosphatase